MSVAAAKWGNGSPWLGVSHRALLDRLTHHVHVLEMNGESYRLKRSRGNTVPQAPDDPVEAQPAQQPSRLTSSDPVSNSPCPANCHHAGGPPFCRPSC